MAAVAAVAAVVAMVAVVMCLVVAVVLAAVAHAHGRLGRLGRPCPRQALAKCPFGPQLGSALCAHFWVREGLEQTPPRGSVTTTLLVHGTILVRQALKQDGS